MMLAGVEAEKLHVEHVGKPGQRMPVGLVGCGERPHGAFAMKSLTDVHVLGDIPVVVIVDELAREHASEGREGDDDEGSGDRREAYGARP